MSVCTEVGPDVQVEHRGEPSGGESDHRGVVFHGLWALSQQHPAALRDPWHRPLAAILEPDTLHLSVCTLRCWLPTPSTVPAGVTAMSAVRRDDIAFISLSLGPSVSFLTHSYECRWRSRLGYVGDAGSSSPTCPQPCFPLGHSLLRCNVLTLGCSTECMFQPGPALAEPWPQQLSRHTLGSSEGGLLWGSHVFLEQMSWVHFCP